MHHYKIPPTDKSQHQGWDGVFGSATPGPRGREIPDLGEARGAGVGEFQEVELAHFEPHADLSAFRKLLRFAHAGLDGHEV